MKKGILLFILILLINKLFATGEPSTYFQIYVPPNNDAVRRDVALIVTAIYDSTTFEIIDDGADGDTDDSKSGILMAGQSYVLYIRDNGINDDARYASGGILKWDGDYFIVKSNKLVYASQSTNSDWQHDWVPSTDKKSIGQKFIIYSPPYSSSKRDINVFPYDNNTTVIFKKISTQPKTNTGFTDVKMGQDSVVFTRKLNIGEDIIYKYTNGRDIMGAGETYMIISDKPITVQYGALYGNERDGGGYVPTSNGSSSGELMYFAVPYQSGGEQEIRIVSWDDANAVKLERYNNGSWVAVKSFTLNRLQANDWVGKTEGNVSYSTVFRITCTAGKRVSVFEGNWFETGAPGTSDMATMVSAENGTTSGNKFLSYMAPPSSENNVVDPFTGKAFGQLLTHVYMFSIKGAVVTVKDAYTGGKKINRVFKIAPGRYADCYLTLSDWKSIYNGTGTPSGPERPYLLIESDNNISVMNSNFQDNWMCYTGTPLEQSFTEYSITSNSNAIPADTVKVTAYINAGSDVAGTKVQVIVEDGLKIVNSTFSGPATPTISGTINVDKDKITAEFDNTPNLKSGGQYKVETMMIAAANDNENAPIKKAVNSTVETIVTGMVNGQLQQSSTTEVVNVNPLNASKLIFSNFSDNLVSKDSTDSWTANWVDVNNDGYDDLFVPDRRSNFPCLLYLNDKKGGFARHTANSFVKDTAISMAGSWVDADNDGDLDLLVINNTRKPNAFYVNNNGTLVRNNDLPFVKNVSYYHGAAFADYDKDGKADLFLCNYFPTRYNELYHSTGSGGYEKELDDVIPMQANQSVGPTWADYDADGYPDLFVPNGNGYKNSLFHNEGNGKFSRVDNAVSNDGGQSVGSCWGDIDNDGDLDLFVTNANSKGNFLYINNGGGNFTKVVNSVVVKDKGTSHGCGFADIDNDGDQDLYVANDSNGSFLYLNDGKGNFTRKTDELPAFNFGKAMGTAWSDYDNDGDLDLFVSTHSGQVNGFFTNNGNSNAWLEIKLTGTVSNKSAVGADVFVKANNIWQMREVNSQSGFGGQNSYKQHFGLGKATTVDSIMVKWPGGIIQYIVNVAPRQIIQVTEPQSVKLVGALYNDLNNNCHRDAGEPLVPEGSVRVNNSYNIFSDKAGYFYTRLNAGAYTIVPLPGKNVVPACSKMNVTIALGKQPDTVWLPIILSCNGSDPAVIFGSTAIRKGYTNNQFTWMVSNKGISKIPFLVAKLKMPATVSISQASQPFSKTETVTENGIKYVIVSWNLSDMGAYEDRLISFNHSVSSTVNIGDTITFNAWIDGAVNDCDYSNNQSKATYTVVGAIDPNEMEVAPVGYGKGGYIMSSDVLTYTIKFQNIGNHPASDVYIIDELPEGLDLSTLKVVASSHPGVSMALSGNRLTFHFQNIYLTDSVSDANGSQGYISFSVSPDKGIMAGTTLVNAASIQFDQYKPVMTNSVTNTIQSYQQEEKLIEVAAYPNPAIDVINLSLSHKMGDYTNKYIRAVSLSNILGEVVFQKLFNPGDECRINLPVTLKGVVLLKVVDNDGDFYVKKILVSKN
ncbi:FG-GAP-like repeat-containing protein [Chitinophaga sancti]|uniref:Conserved repeat domain-containing protein n=1 Tax=Chitinophaga sancti TaxID=1004 RepID=A0A1K1S0R6_9BACT|nr:FG-GAP-like repeat-containing protein [Chitinophaga sancti]WQD59784.1 FG-GAP-like repeat-containing protein [Chitinophaga sancti]WQG88085.1 FG-GAP-like repeat-containing protein [Chitinophaga sancti]SFW77754.1 conserved repeat domain-containing protein [Chitinophaga sancti]